MSDIKKNIRHIFWMFFYMFISIIIYLTYFAFFEAYAIVNSTLNPRVRISRENIQRGTIYDRNGQVIAYTYENIRNYPYGRAFAHVIGHTSVGHAAVEERYNFHLTNLSGEMLQRVNNLAFGTKLYGDSLNLTLDTNLQNYAYNALGNRRGSIVVMQPTTGDILAMVSYPTYNPNTAATEWQQIINNEYSPLLNRATQGLYAPGSTFKIMTVASGIRSNIINNFTHHCNGYIIINGEIIRCFNNVSHGYINATRAFALSCNTYFVALAYEMGIEKFVYYTSSFFNETKFSLPVSQSQFNLSYNSSIGYLMQTSIGQGQTLVTPLYMTMISSAIYNNGVIKMPNVVKNTQQNNILNTLLPTTQNKNHLFTKDISTELQNMMVQVVNNGTGQLSSIQSAQLAGKTGTAENDAGYAHGWFTGFIVDNDIAITIMLENSDGTGLVLPLVRNIANFAINLNN